MVLLADLTDEEKALFCILTDPAGIDFAEMFWVDPDRADGCWRAYPYQIPWWRCSDERQIDQCARDLGKSLGIAMRSCNFPFRRPGQQRALVAPEKNHLTLLTGVVEDRLMATWITRQMMRGGRQSIKHQPFEVPFLNGTTVVGRIPQRDGKGLKGLHAMELEVDEGQDIPEPAYREMVETTRRGLSGGFRLMIHGVTKGVHDTFFRFTQPKSGFTVHRYVGMNRPTWSQKEKDQKIDEYMGYDSPDYKRNVLGLHGDQTSPLFPLAQLMLCVDQDEGSDYNVSEYRRIKIIGEEVESEGSVHGFLDFPALHLAENRYERFWMGMDIGHTIAPSEILVCGEHHPKGRDKKPVLRILLRIQLLRVTAPDQGRVIRWLIHQYHPVVFAMDSTGAGQPIVQFIEDEAGESGDHFVLDSIKGYNFSSKVAVDLVRPDPDAVVDPWAIPEDDEPEVVMRNVLEASTDYLRLMVDERTLEIPWDTEIIGQMQGQTFCCDTETEIFTKRGWLSCTDLRVGDETLGVVGDCKELVSQWTSVDAVNIFVPRRRLMVRMLGQGHDSLTTIDHRWMVRSPSPTTRKMYWKESGDFMDETRWGIPRCAIRSDPPMSAIYKDDFIELVAWVFTEGCWISPGKVAISQSPSANPGSVAKIERLLKRLLGEGSRDIGRGKSGIPLWSVTTAREEGYVNTYRILDRGLVAQLREVLTEEKVVDPGFLVALTPAQLDLFIDTALEGDGCTFTRERIGRGPTDVRVFVQYHDRRTRSFEMACALRGYATNTQKRDDRQVVTVMHRRFAHTSSMKKEIVLCEGKVWCPTTSTGTWLARRNGTVYFTGNTLAKTGINEYGRRSYSAGSFHIVDAERMVAIAYCTEKLNFMLKEAERARLSHEDVFLSTW